MTTPALIILGDNRWTLRRLPDASIDAVVCDPPYGLGKEPDMAEVLGHWLAGDDYQATGGGFMGKSWDSFVPGPATWREVLRVLKPGGHLLAFAGTRTLDMMGLAIRLGGFEIRDTVAWLYGSGFPKSLDVSKAIDKAAGANRPVVGSDGRSANESWLGTVKRGETGFGIGQWDITAPATTAAEEWQGWGTALKPAFEPVVVARKPLTGTVAANVLAHGTGAINIDGCRIPASDKATFPKAGCVRHDTDAAYGFAGDPKFDTTGVDKNPDGRWPANVALDEAAAELLDEQSGTLHNAGNLTLGTPTSDGATSQVPNVSKAPVVVYKDKGGASRFFYVAKASKAERNLGCDELPSLFAPTMGNGIGGKEHDPETATPKKNTHPTVKPVALMAWLVRLVTPPGGIVLDPFLGSGTTGVAALNEGFGFVGMEREQEYVTIAEARLRHAAADGGREVSVVDFNLPEAGAA